MKRVFLVLATCLVARSVFADVEIACREDQWPEHLRKAVSVEDLTVDSGSAQLIIQLPIRDSGLELRFLHLRRFDGPQRSLWVGLAFTELEENRSWTTVEIARKDLPRYQLVAQYHVTGNKGASCDAYEFPIALPIEPSSQ